MKYMLHDNTTASVNYRAVGKGGKAIEDHPHAACFASFFNKSIPKDAVGIEFYGDRTLVPYSDESIARWVKALNDLEFPCAAELTKKDYTFKICTSEYKHKLHILSTLMLLRLLNETYLVTLPEKFFLEQDEHPKSDAFKLLQKVHINKGDSYLPTGHMVTYHAGKYDQYKTKEVAHDELFDNFKASRMPLHHIGRGKYGFHAVNQAWWGGYVEKVEAKDEF
jgi:hypothetical protein